MDRHRPSLRGTHWSSEDLHTVRRLYNDGQHLDDIACAVGRTVAAIKTKLHDMGLKRERRVVPRTAEFGEPPIREVLTAAEIAELYERAGIRYVDTEKSRPDQRRLATDRRASWCGNAAAMCAYGFGPP